MERLVVATTNCALLSEIEDELGHDFEVRGAFDATELAADELRGCAALILDQGFNEHGAIDVLMQLAQASACPIVVLTMPDDPQSAAEALRAGATNYLIRGSEFRRFLKVSIAEGMQRFREREDGRARVRELQQRIVQMEAALGGNRDVAPRRPPPAQTDRKRELLTRIGTLLRSGDFVLPAYPRVNESFKELVAAGAGMGEIARELEQDVGMATRLISVANSARYGNASDARTVEQALGRIGLRDAGMFVEMASSRSLFGSKDSKYKAMMHDLWSHSLATGFMARGLADTLGLHDASHYFTAGMFHDIGKVVLVQILAELDAREALSRHYTRADTDQLLHAQHGPFGGQLLERWKFPEPVRQAAAFHEAPDQADNACTELQVVHLANHLANASGFSQGDPPLVNLRHLPQVAALGLTPDDLDAVKKTVTRQMHDRAFA